MPRPPPTARIGRLAQDLRAAQAAVADEREAARPHRGAAGERAPRRAAEETRKIRDQLGCAPEGLPGARRSWPTAPLPALDEADRQLTRLKADRERLGGVNLQADDDLAGLASSSRAWTRRRPTSRRPSPSCAPASPKSTTRARSRLQAAFDAVNAPLPGSLFTTLFGGGEARLEMIEARGPAGGRPGDHRQAARQEAGHPVAAARAASSR